MSNQTNNAISTNRLHGGGPSLADLLTARPSGLAEAELWAILCQAVQALQDLFLSDGASSESCIPLVTPSTLILSSRGRVKLCRSGSKLFGCGPPAHLAAGYLAPEYRLNKHSTDTETEKMWIYALGETLKRAREKNSTSTTSKPNFGHVLNEMTKVQAASRATLMLLLEIISEYCRRRQQNRPFSHIVMDLHQEAMATIEMAMDTPWGPPAMPELRPRTRNFDANADGAATIPRRWTHHARLTREASTSMEEVRPRSLCAPGSPPPAGAGRRLRARRRPVDRAASRLYRPARAHQPEGACVGPEFVVRAGLPPTQVHLAGFTGAMKNGVTVILLNGQKVQVFCNVAATTCGQLFEAIVQKEHIEENFMLGLSALIAGDFVFVPSDTRLAKALQHANAGGASPNAPLTLFMRVRFFLPTLRGVRSAAARHLLYLQLRRAILEHQLPCSFSQLIELDGLALQAEFGDYGEKEHGARDYFLIEHYVPETMSCAIENIDGFRQELIQSHIAKRGIGVEKAELDFMFLAQSLPHYGGHFYTAHWMLKDNSNKAVWLYISAQGINLYERDKSANNCGPQLYESFEWKNIQTLCYSKHYLCILPHQNTPQFRKLKKFKLKMDNKKSYFTFRLASLHHQFFLRLRTEYTSLHSLSHQFGIPLKEMKNTSNSLCQLEFLHRAPLPLPRRDDKRPGVKMGTRMFSHISHSLDAAPPSSRSHSPTPSNFSSHFPSHSPSPTSTSTSLSPTDAYILDVNPPTPPPHHPFPDFHESLSDTLLAKLDQMSFADERLLAAVTLDRAPSGSLGVQITEGSDGNVYVQSVIFGGAAHRTGAILAGDQIVAVDGRSLLGLNYANALNLLKNTGESVEFVFARVAPSIIHSQATLKLTQCANLSNMTAGDLSRFTLDASRLKLHGSPIEKHLTENCRDLSNVDKYGEPVPYHKHIRYEIEAEREHFMCKKALPVVKNGGGVSLSRSLSKSCTELRETERVGGDWGVRGEEKWFSLDRRGRRDGKGTGVDFGGVAVAVPRSLGLGRKWRGPVRYPVTPIKKLDSLDDPFNCLSNSDDEQVFI